MNIMFLVDWEDLSVITDSFERAVDYVDHEARRIGAELETIGNFEDSTAPWRAYRYTYVAFDGSNKTVDLQIVPIEKI